MILVTGGNGMIARNLAKHLVDKGEEVLLFSHHPATVPSFLEPYWNKKVKEEVGDILDFHNFCLLMKKYSIESIIHTAAVYHPGGGNIRNVFFMNLEGLINILEAGRIFDVRRVTFTSSTTTYFGSKTTPNQEDQEVSVVPQPTYFGLLVSHKKAADQILIQYTMETGLDARITRLGRIYGPLGVRRLNPIEVMVESALAGTTADLTMYTAENNEENIYVKDVVKGIGLVHLAKKLNHTAYNIADDSTITYREMAELVKKILPNADIRFGTDPRTRILHEPVGMERIKQELGYVKEYDLERGLRDYIAWLREGKY